MPSLEDLPALMDKMHWPVAAALMRRWFAGAAWTMPPLVKTGTTPMSSLGPAHLDQTTVTLGWLDGFARVRHAFTLAESAWQHDKAIAVLKASIARAAATRGAMPWRFGDLHADVTRVDAECQINYVTVGDRDDPFDDFYGAIGRGLLKVAVSGMVSAPRGRKQIVIDRIGIYLRDTYDFNGDQFLGVWNDDGIVGSRFTEMLGYLGRYPEIPLKGAAGGIQFKPPGGATGGITAPRAETAVSTPPVAHEPYRVTNASFRNWRDANNKGGDFVVLSKVKVIPLPRSHTVAL